jgi:acetylornithine deacetylase/succinyl-diaminopimelate desuccinylase-like protein
MPRGDLVLALHADEEVGEDYGMSWLAREHEEVVRADFAVNEGGGERCTFGGRVLYLCGVGEKATAPFTVRVRGRAGHASVPSIADNALVKAAPIVEALARLEPPKTLLPPIARFLGQVLGDVPPLDQALDRARELHPLAAELVEPLLSLTLSPTMIQASHQLNVVPGTCEIGVDCRLLPGQTPSDVEPLLRSALGDGTWELEWAKPDPSGGTLSPTDTPLWSAIEAWVDDIEPGAQVAPILMAGFTDSHYMRAAFGTVAYGFFPLRGMDVSVAARLVHSADERIAVDDLEDGVDLFRHVARTLGS